MDWKDVASLAQAGALTVGFLYLVYRLPALYGAWLHSQVETKRLDNDRATAERAALSAELALEREACERRHRENLEATAAERQRREAFANQLHQEQLVSRAEGKELRHAIANLANLVSVWIAVVKQVAGIVPPAATGTPPESPS